MSSTTTVAEFAAELNKPTATLIEQLTSAGVAKAQADDKLSESDKQKLLSYLQSSHGTASTERKKITLVKKSTTEIKQADATGRARTIQVEVRKKRTFVKRDDATDQATEAATSAAEAQAAEAENADLIRREDEANRNAEQLRLQEDALAEKRRTRELQDEKDAQSAKEAADSEQTAQADAQAVPAKEVKKPVKASAKPVVGSRVFPDKDELSAAAAASNELIAADQAAKAAVVDDARNIAESSPEVTCGLALNAASNACIKRGENAAPRPLLTAPKMFAL